MKVSVEEAMAVKGKVKCHKEKIKVCIR